MAIKNLFALNANAIICGKNVENILICMVSIIIYVKYSSCIQPTFTYPKSTIETLEEGVKYV